MGVTTVVKDYGTSILNAIRDNDLKALRSIFEKHLKSDGKIAALCITDIKHKPTKKFACPLILAARQDDPSIIKYMMDCGVDPNFVHHTIFTSKRRETVTALHIAADLGLFSTVEVLLNANADPNIVDHNDETALHVAVKKADRVMTRMLLAKGADPSVLDRRGNASLHIATLFGHLQLVKTLLKYDADVYQKGQLGAIPSHIAAREGHIHLVQVFCSRDVGNINIKIPCFSDQREKAPIHLAAENGHVETVLALVDQFNAEVNLRDSDGNTPLHCTVLNPYHPYKMREKDYFYATAKTLVKYRVAINEKNKFGETALHLAAANQYQKIVELLLSVGANPFAENNQHLKPIDVVPEEDPVTKQLLKNAMANPRSAPLSASMLSLQRDLNISGMALPPTGSNRVIPTLLRNGLPPHMQQSHRINSSFQSVSSLTSLAVDDVRGKPMSSTGKPSSRDARQRYERENEISTYANGSRRHRQSSRDRRPREDGGGSLLSLNSLAESGHRADHHRSRRHRSSTIERQNAKNEKHLKSQRKATEDFEDEEVFEQSPSVTPSKNRHRKKDHPVYENLKGHASDDDRLDDRRSRKDRKKQQRHQENNTEQSVVPYGSRDAGIFRGNEGVKVHTIPGKPSLIEVQYDRGPITIAVDSQGNDFDTLPPYNPIIGDSNDEFSWDVEEIVEEEDRESVASKKKSRSRKEIKESEETDDRRRKKGSKNKKDSSSVYSNQEEIMEEMKRKQHQNELLRRRKSLEEKETRTRELAERRREEQEEEERRARREEEKARKQAKKLQRRRLRQEQFKEEQELEGLPTEEEPPERPFVVELPEEVLNESFDSDSFEAEQESSRAKLILSTQRRLSETTESLKKRWSHDEDDEEIHAEDEPHLKSTHKQPESPVPAKRPIKPPRPSVSQNSFDSELHETTENLEQEDETLPVIINATEIKPMDGRVERFQGVERPNDVVNRYQTFQVQLTETNKIEVIRMETVSEKPTEDPKRGNLAEKLVVYDQEPGFTSPLRNAGSQDIEIRHGLNMRVTGEVPKAYNRKEKSSARKAFMLSPPVGIESSSEASDSEFGSRSSLTRSPALEVAAQRQKEWSEPLQPFYGKNSNGKSQDSGATETKLVLLGKLTAPYAKPYESFGKIETKTDALEAAILEAEQKALEEQQSEISDTSMDLSGGRNRHGNTLSTFSPSASTKVNVNLDEMGGQNSPRIRTQVPEADLFRDPRLPVIQSSNMKVSNQFRNVEDVQMNLEKVTSTVHGQTFIVQGSVVPTVSHVKETDIVSTETDDDYFDDDSFDDISEGNQLEDLAASILSKDDKTLSLSGEGLSMSTEIDPLEEIRSNPDHSQETDRQIGKSAEENIRNLKENLEVYDQEPGMRRPEARIGTSKITVGTNDRTSESVSESMDLETTVSAHSVEDYLPEDNEVALINSKSAAKTSAKKGKKNKKKDSTSEVSKVENEDGGLRAKKTKAKTKKSKQLDLVETSDVWKEAMEGTPLASSEMFESVPGSKERFTTLNSQNKGLNDDKIPAENEETLSEMPTRKKKGDKKQHPPKNAALVSELRNNIRFKQEDEPSFDDITTEDFPISSGLDIKIPPIGSKWTDQHEDSALDITIPPFDPNYYKLKGVEDSAKWNLPSGADRAKQSFTNLDDIIIPRPSDRDDSFSPDQDRTQDSAERIVGRRQQRMSKQGVQPHKSIRETIEQITNLDDLSSPDEESARTIESEFRDSDSTMRKGGKDDRSNRNDLTEDDTISQSSGIKTLDRSFNEDMDLLPPGARIVPEKTKFKVLTSAQGVRPPKPVKPSHLIAPTPAKREEPKPAVLVSKPLYPAKRSAQPASNTAYPSISRSYSAGAEVVEMPNRGDGIRYITEKPDLGRSSGGKFLPKHPPGSLYGENQTAVASDTEIGRQQRPTRHGRLGPAHSEAEASDLEMPVAPGPGKSYRQAALETINRRPHPTFVLRQPGHHDKSFAFVRKLYKPQTRHSVTSHLVPTAGRYGDSELRRTSRRSGTESEGDTENEYSCLNGEMSRQGQTRSTTVGRGRGKVVTIQDVARRGRYGYRSSRRDEPPRIMEPGPVDFRKFDVTARLWMEQVDRKTVLKSETMYLSVLPEGQELPDEIIQRAKYQSALVGDGSTVPLQWVMARSRAIAHKSRAAGEPKSECGNMSGYDSDLNLFRPSSPSGRQLILFFKVGSNWLDLAWVLFDAIQNDSDTVRMIKDIQLKNPDRLTDQVHDLMHRWWKKKGADATIDELQKALDTIHLAYIHEEYVDAKAPFVPHSDTEDDLDIGEVSDADPNVSRIVQEYEVRSLNASFVADSGNQVQELDPEAVLRQLQKSSSVSQGSTALYTKASRTSRAESRDSSFERSPHKPVEDKLNESSGGEDKKPAFSNPILQRLKKSFKHETNL